MKSLFGRFRLAMGLLVIGLIAVVTAFAAPPGVGPFQVSTLAQVESEAILASGTFTAFDGNVERFDALRFLLVDVGAGTMVISADWQTTGGTSIQGSAETITLVSDFLEVPVRSPRVQIVITETSTTNPLDVTGSILGVNQ